jgi:DNA-binding transcriptional LysR family regulator
MNWDDITIYLVIAKMGGLKKAAKVLGIHHSSCARRINTLEHDLGIQLFDRLPSGYALTQGGEQLLRSSQQIQEGFNAIDRDVLGKDLRIEGDLCLTLTNGLACHLLMPDLNEFMPRYPEINLKIEMTYGVRDLASREADVAIRHVDNPPDSLTGKRVGRISESAYASKVYLAEHDVVNQPEDCHWLGWGDARTSESKHLKWAGKDQYPSVPVRGDMYSDVLQLAAVKGHMGLGSLPCYLGDADPDLVRLPNVKAVPSEWLWVLAHKGMAKNARVRALIDFLAEVFVKHEGLLGGKVIRA